ncbi:MAG: glutathione S-transferase N-terminal domain-containing protein [Burkholderiales bacterium]|nr:glutathione S-transferase N-terminal domain-containing protein [Burkholderiales bacterium]
MKLFISASSPFARKVRIVAREKGLAGGLSEIDCNPFSNPTELLQHNKLCKVPTFVHGDLVLYDSPVICEYLDSRNESPRLIPLPGGDRWRVLRAQAVADGVMDLAVALTMELRRPVAEQAPAAQERWRGQITGAVDMMEAQLPDLSGILNLGHIAFAAALGYLDFRHPEMRWRDGHPGLAAWYDPFAERASMKQTAPSDSSYAL